MMWHHWPTTTVKNNNDTCVYWHAPDEVRDCLRDAVVTGAGVALATFVQQLHELGGEPASQPVQLSDPTVLVLLRDNLADSDTNSYSFSAFPALSSDFSEFFAKMQRNKSGKTMIRLNDFISVILVERIQFSNITIIMICQTTTQSHS